MTFLIPKKFIEDLDSNGYLKVDSIWADKEIKGLFLSPYNQSFINRHLSNLITHPQFIADNDDLSSVNGEQTLNAEQLFENRDDNRKRGPSTTYRNKIEPKHMQMAKLFKANIPLLSQVLPELMEAYPIPYDEDWTNAINIHQLHFLNKKFLLETGRVLVQSPEILIAGFEDVNTETGEVEIVEYDYSAASYADGVWRPEHLFTQSNRNRENPYWVLQRVEFSDTPDARGPGNKWKRVGDYKDERGIYDEIDYDNAEKEYNRLYDDLTPDDIMRQDLMAEKGIQNVPLDGIEHHTPIRSNMERKDRFSRGAQVPFWQSTVQNRPYSRDPNGLREGGESDRRTQWASGYDMRRLTNRSSDEKRTVPLNKHYE